MPSIGIRELKTHASEIIRNVRQKKSRYVITYRGQPVGVLSPLSNTEVSPSAEMSSAWDELVQLGQEIADGWQSEQTSAGILSEMRR